MQFKEEYKSKQEKINNWLETVMPKAEGDQKEVYEAMRYSVFANGKRIRPVISMAVCELVGGNVDEVMPFASGIELIHTYSLIHDDLPAMDDDDIRRGAPSCHKKFSESTAILAGDALQSFAFEIMSRADINPALALEAIRTVALASGPDGMVGGQIMDLKGCNGDAVKHQRMNTLKTGALIMSSAWVGAIIGQADVSDYQAIGNYAKNLGLAFQVKDDILDVEGNSEIMGKNTGNDKKQDKYTYVNLLGMDKSKRLLLELTDNAKDSIAVFGEKSFFLQDLAEYLYNREN